MHGQSNGAVRRLMRPAPGSRPRAPEYLSSPRPPGVAPAGPREASLRRGAPVSAHRAGPAGASAAAPLAQDLQAILAGLTAPQKMLSPKYFYDATGSRLFDEICELPEYYLTRAERWIMERHLGEMAALIGPRVSVIELGSGSSRKIRLLLEHLVDPVAYVPVDISAD